MEPEPELDDLPHLDACPSSESPEVTSDLLPLEEGGDTGTAAISVAAEDEAVPLLYRLDRRQNEVLAELDRLNAEIEQLVIRCQDERSQVA